jgi:hypothetical protein
VAAFLERANELLSSLVSLRLAVDHAADRCSSFPNEPVGDPSVVTQYAYQGARLHHTDDRPDTSSAVPAALRASPPPRPTSQGRRGGPRRRSPPTA